MPRFIVTLVLCFLFTPVWANAQTRALTDSQWQEDIATAVEAIRNDHPNPFRGLTSEEYDVEVARLMDELPTLRTDKDVALRLAALVALIEDGHTRLSLPRTVPELGFNPAHSNDEPAHDSMTFGSLPFRFYLFEEGLFIIEATDAFEAYIGAQVVKFGDTLAEEAVVAVRPVLYAENDYTAKIYAADRLALIDVLHHFGLSQDTSSASLTLDRNGDVETQSFEVVRDDAYAIATAQHDGHPLTNRHREKKRWFAQVPDERALYIKMDEIEMFPETPTADFMADALGEARRLNVRKIILDLRDNTGGSSSFNAAIINAFAQSEFNEYGRLYVLTGRTTFSAASMLMVAFEEYVNAIFVGEPSGARPTSYGDPRRVRLPHSGLTLRVSTLVWPSSFAGDFRPFIETHLDAPPTAANYFSGRDSAIAAALAYAPPEGPAAQMAELFEKDKLQSGIIRFFTWLRTPLDESHERAADDIIAYGHAYLDDGELRKGRFMMAMARDYFPTNADARAGLGRAMELNDDPESARGLYDDALEIDTSHQGARDGLARLRAREQGG